MGKRFLIYSCIFALFFCQLGVAWAGKANDTLNILHDVELNHADNYFNTDRMGVILSRHIWDSLLYRDIETYEYKPLLAESYKWIDDTTMEFTLRRGIVFHNGEKFDADDVVYTLNWVSNPKNGVKTQRNVSWIDRCEKTGEYKVRVYLKDPFPAALEYMSGPIPIYPDEYYKKVGPDGMGLKPIGTGPYRVVEVVPAQKIVMTKNEEYFKESPKGQPKIGNLNIRFIKEMNTQIAELMSGRADWLWRVPTDQAERMETIPTIQVKNAQTMRVFYLTFDAANKGGLDSPINNVLVRKAVAYAVDREKILKTLVRGNSQLIHAACFPTQFGCIQDVKKYDYDPEKAKSLLAEAGYDDGLTVDFYSYRDPKYLEAMMDHMAAVGIDAKLHMGTYAAVRDKIRAGQVPLAMMTWGSYSINDISAITGNFFRGTADDNALDKDVMEWLKIGDTSVDREVRKENYTKALKKIAEKVYWLPLWSYNVNYAYTKDLHFVATPDEIPRWFNASWK